jgi:hypothetical protein
VINALAIFALSGYVAIQARRVFVGQAPVPVNAVPQVH